MDEQMKWKKVLDVIFEAKQKTKTKMKQIMLYG